MKADSISVSSFVAMWSVIAIGLFNSIMFPTIFTLAIAGLGKFTSQGSSLLVMAIVGGALIPPLQGIVADSTGSLQLSFLIPMICYLYIAYYGFVGYKQKEVAPAPARWLRINKNTTIDSPYKGAIFLSYLLLPSL